jgi:hypothetical protein
MLNNECVYFQRNRTAFAPLLGLSSIAADAYQAIIVSRQVGEFLGDKYGLGGAMPSRGLCRWHAIGPGRLPVIPDCLVNPETFLPAPS